MAEKGQERRKNRGKGFGGRLSQTKQIKRSGILTIVNPAYDFLKVDYENPNLNGGIVRKVAERVKRPRALIYSGLATYLLTPIQAFAANGDTFNHILQIVGNGLDFGFVLVGIFAGINWMMGHRARAIEMLIGNVLGYLVAIHAGDLRDFLKTL